ncbi:condensation domain-containing protein [Erwinia sp. JH02]|uniref:condensation domain-containing protein n=1 Tax=Erwinia sp. JH02 TaxID=2733394 RepID=UPI001487F768|nr:condensation domain-containing protein [Erwinia sp. JH02]NNS10147.1 condensation protein [Erwinia sp. JH02]
MSQNALASDWLPLTPAQLDFWEEFTCHRDRALSTVAHFVEFGCGVDSGALRKAIEATLAETDVFALQLTLPAGASTPLQRVEPSRVPKLQRFDLQDCDHPQHAARHIMQADIDKPLDLLNDALAAAWLIQLAPERYIWYTRAHHMIIDGFGMALIEHRCAALYRHFLGLAEAGEPLNRFPAFLDEEMSWQASSRYLKDRRYWRQWLDSDPPLAVLSAGREDYCLAPLHAEQALTGALNTRLLQVAQHSETGWPDLLLALSAAWLCFTLPLRRDNPYAPFPVWVPMMNRRGSIAGYVPALAVNTLPLMIDIRPGETLAQFLPRVTADVQRLRSHGRYRVEQLAADYGLSSGERFFYTPLINVMPFDPPDFSGCDNTRYVMASGNVDSFNVSWRGRSDGSELILDIDADPQVHQTDFAGKVAQLQAFMQRALATEQWHTPIAQLI